MYDPEVQDDIMLLRTDVISVLKEFHQETYLEMFGDHAQIIITPEGIQIEGYAHE